MSDKILYETLGQILYNEAPSVDKNIHSLTRISSGSNGFSFWVGDSRKGSTFSLSSQSMIEFDAKIMELHAYFLELEMGKWNVMHFIVHPGSNFTTNFEFSEDLENRKMPFWKFLRKFD